MDEQDFKLKPSHQEAQMEVIVLAVMAKSPCSVDLSTTHMFPSAFALFHPPQSVKVQIQAE